VRQRKLAGGVFPRAERGVGAGIATRWNGLAGVIAVLVTVLILSAAALASLAPGVITALLSSRRGSAAAAWETRLGRATLSDLTGLYPGAANDIEYIPFSVTNVGGAEKPLSAIVASIAREPNGDAKTADGADIRGCQASWFTVSAATWGRVLPADIGPGRSYTGRIAVTMRDSSTNQDACRDTSPAVTISAR
jgi:hypothetical protein